MKKSILFIADKPNWAYHNLIRTWAEGLDNDFDCYIAFAQDFALRKKDFSFGERLISNLLNRFRNKDLKYFVDKSRRFSCPVYKYPPVYKVQSGEKTEKIDFDLIFECAYYFQYTTVLPFRSRKKYVGLYTDSFPHEGPGWDIRNSTNVHSLNRNDFYQQYLKHYDGIIAGSRNLIEDYLPLTQKITFANGIYRQNEFVINEKAGSKEGLTLGWTGTPDRPMKGFREIIEPAVEMVKNSGRIVTLKTKFAGPYEDLLGFYKDVDLALIASAADTGPSLFAEAALSGVPSVSTKIGFPKMVIRHGENGLFIERNKEDLAAAIIKLYDDRKLLKTFSEKIREDYMKILDNQISVNNLKKLFNNP
ncbi:sugar transferase, PEP-CTERM/EpsH1 system associated [Chryseobacterium taklimakanense]|uniref:Sugar transferase, PEP-CTERM/EpsH1 system associated n=1 Tax=Chryseobacterium taklimakanense TaxID=536441 RepID=A0A239XLL1_9FLAO|nr:glycosyltransferase [Chryseobacterium taklimakanense]SNV47909.1 sugar transferase, PEP-CTERM/EpsH1 system associated [Chryseobacterium taklimakanense]